MHIGAGKDTIDFSPESSILYTQIGGKEDNIPYIPSSSIKGIFRSDAELIASMLQKEAPDVKYICSETNGKRIQCD